MSVDRPGETEAELVDRRGREREARDALNDAAMAMKRRASGARPTPWFSTIELMPKGARSWQ